MANPAVSTVDLHTHTTASDGLLAPAALVSQAHAQGLSVLGITDHDTIDGLAEAMTAAELTGITLVPGVELSTSIRGYEVHVLGYFVDPADSGFRAKLADLARSRIRRIERMVERLNELGYPIALEPLLMQAETGTIGRPHIARALVEIGAVGSVGEAFDMLLTPGKPAFVPRERFTPEDAVALILANGAVPVLAHPYTTGDTIDEVEGVLDRLVAAGLRGMEVFYGEYDAGQHVELLAIADRRGLIPTGGSDYHGPNFKEGRDLGSAPVPESVWERLRLEARR
ncbi:MAG: PHP domain-containing protein [Thermomicrobiales bacterium]